jgi:predicted ATPase
MVPGGPPLIGRDGQLQALRSALSETEKGSGCLVLVAGEPGIGKTRLLDELAAMAHAR